MLVLVAGRTRRKRADCRLSRAYLKIPNRIVLIEDPVDEGKVTLDKFLHRRFFCHVLPTRQRAMSELSGLDRPTDFRAEHLIETPHSEKSSNTEHLEPWVGYIFNMAFKTDIALEHLKLQYHGSRILHKASDILKEFLERGNTSM